MDDSQKPQFVRMLAEVLASYGKPMPEAAITKAWIANLTPYPIHVIESALRAYRDENGEFAPVPAGIAMRCKLMDGRPGPEEAWAIALTSRDEADTVVWTAECAEAFALCQPILSLGDEVGARMAFKEAYARIVAQARAERRPAMWSASLGWDLTKRTAVLSKASVAGLLPAPTAAALLPGPADTAPNDQVARDQIAAIRKMLADGEREKLRRLILREYEQWLDDELFKRLTQERVDQYQASAA